MTRFVATAANEVTPLTALWGCLAPGGEGWLGI